MSTRRCLNVNAELQIHKVQSCNYVNTKEFDNRISGENSSGFDTFY